MQSGFKPLYEGIEYILFWSKFATGEALVVMLLATLFCSWSCSLDSLPLLYYAVSAIAYAPWLMCENNNAKVKVTSSPLVDGVSFLIESLMSLITCILLVNSTTFKVKFEWFLSSFYNTDSSPVLSLKKIEPSMSCRWEEFSWTNYNNVYFFQFWQHYPHALEDASLGFRRCYSTLTQKSFKRGRNNKNNEWENSSPMWEALVVNFIFCCLQLPIKIRTQRTVCTEHKLLTAWQLGPL